MKKRIFIVVVLLLFLAGIVLVLLHTPMVRSKALGFLVDSASGSLRLHLSAESLNYNLFSLRFRLKGLSIGPEETPDMPTFLKAGEVEVELSAAELFRKKIHIRELAIKDFEIHFQFAADGRTNLPLPTTKQAEPPEEKASFLLPLDRMRLENGLVLLRDDSRSISATLICVFVIEENSREIIEDITVSGNALTREKVIRRGIEFEKEEPVHILAVNKTRKKLYDLGVFERVNIDIIPLEETGASAVPGKSPDAAFSVIPCRIELRLAELKPYRLRYGFQCNTETAFGAIGELVNRNLGGRAETLGTHFRINREEWDLRGFFRSPVFPSTGSSAESASSTWETSIPAFPNSIPFPSERAQVSGSVSTCLISSSASTGASSSTAVPANPSPRFSSASARLFERMI